MGSWINQNQSAFMEVGMIQDNIVITDEVFYCLKQRTGHNKKNFVAKLDMNKAHDILEWSFLEKCMSAFSFCLEWI